MSFRALLLSGLLLLTACADINQTSYERITVQTPGARDVICYLIVDGIKNRVNPPETVTVTKSDQDMVVDCRAAGNRRQTQVIKPKVMTRYGAADVVTGLFPGLAWDYLSKSIYQYPDLIIVDFTHAQITPEPMPAQNAPDIKQPEEYQLEEILPGTPKMRSDSNKEQFRLIPREKPAAPADEEAVPVEPPAGKMIETGGQSHDKGDLINAPSYYVSPSDEDDTLDDNGPPASSALPYGPPSPSASPAATAQPTVIAPAPESAGPPTGNAPSSALPAPLYPGQ